METVPMFQTDAELRAALRLTTVKGDAEDQYFAAVRLTRLDFWQRLGAARVAQLMALVPATPPTPPSTEDELLRDLATQIEILVCRSKLMETMTSQFKDGSGTSLQSWNQEAALRNNSQFSVNQQLRRLDPQIQQGYEILEGTETPGEVSTINVTTIQSESFEAYGNIPLGEFLYGQDGVFRYRGVYRGGR